MRAEEDTMSETPTAEQQERLDEMRGLFWRTCDQCAHLGVCFINGDAYICEECQERHEGALNHAHAAARLTGLVPLLRDAEVDRLTWAIVKAYTEFSDA